MANRNIDKKYHFLYKTTNLINEKYYYGIHSTNEIEDGYLGSGVYLTRAIRKYGKENFKRVILEFFDNREDLVQAEQNLITKEMIQDKYCMNCQLGGEGFNTLGMVTVRDQDSNCFTVFNDDPRYLSGELVGATKGFIKVKDKEGKIVQVSITDPKYLSGELVGVTKGKVNVKDKNGNILQVDKTDSRYLSGELQFVWKNKINVIDNEGNKLFISNDDPRYLSGELISIHKGKTHTDESKEKMSKSSKGKQKGDKNSQYGTKWYWINNDIVNKKIKIEELNSFINLGWKKGLKFDVNYKKENHSQFGKKYVYINNSIINKKIELNKLNDYLSLNWQKGRIKKINS